MAAGKDHRMPHEIIEAEKAAYLDALPPPDPDWPPDVCIVYEDIHDHLFNFGLQVGAVRSRCGAGDNNISSHFKYFLGQAPKNYILHHRMELAKRLLHDRNVQVVQVAFAVGFQSASAFSQAFSRRVGCSPSMYREQSRRK